MYAIEPSGPLLTEVLTADTEFILVFDVVRNEVLGEREGDVHGALEFVHQLALALEALLLLFDLFLALLAYEHFSFAPAAVTLGEDFLAVGRHELDLGGVKFGVVTRRSPELEFARERTRSNLDCREGHHVAPLVHAAADRFTDLFTEDQEVTASALTALDRKSVV